jgi:predicted amidohydrolase
MVVVVGMIARATNGRPVNVSILIDHDGTVRGVHQKAHLTPMYEQPYLEAGNTFDTHETAVARIGHVVCADLSLPETTRILSLKGAQIICGSLAAWSDPGIRQMYLTSHTSPARAIDNGVFMVACNMVGQLAGREFFGRSRIMGPDGRLLAEGRESPQAEELVIAELDVGADSGLPFSLIARRRPEIYHDILTPTHGPPAGWVGGEGE